MKKGLEKIEDRESTKPLKLCKCDVTRAWIEFIRSNPEAGDKRQFEAKTTDSMRHWIQREAEIRDDCKSYLGWCHWQEQRNPGKGIKILGREP